MIDDSVRRHFPVLSRAVNGKPVIYLDSTATSLKPLAVIDAMDAYYTRYTANVFRGIYRLSEEATEKYEEARSKIAAFIGAADSREIVFVRNTTEAINLIYYSWASQHICSGDEVVTTILEHHSNFVPWQQLSQSGNIHLRLWNCGNDGFLDMRDLDVLVGAKTKLVAITAASNVTGTLNDVAAIVKAVKQRNPNSLVLVDAAQAVPHMPVNVRAWNADFVVFSGHKMMGPTGIGVLWSKREILESMKPFLYGGDMIREVHTDKTIFNDIPHKFEAGTPHIAGAIGLGAAVSYLEDIGMENVRAHEERLTEYALLAFREVPDLTVYGPENAHNRGGVISFTMKGIHPHDIAQILDEDNICIRVGFHCAQPLHEFLGCGPTARASFYVYNTTEDIDELIKGLKKVKKVFK